jgi:hypothetical protein
MEKSLYIKKVLTSSISFEDLDGNSLTLKISDGDALDKAIAFTGKKVRVRVYNGYVIVITDWGKYWEKNMEKLKRLSNKELKEVEDGRVELK